MELSLFKIIICSSLVLNSYLVKLVISEDISELSSVEYYNKSAVLERTKRFLFYPKNTIMQVRVNIINQAHALFANFFHKSVLFFNYLRLPWV